MWPLNRPRGGPPLSFRLKRLWRRRRLRRAVILHGPAVALLFGGFMLAGSPGVHALIDDRIAAAREALTGRPAFAITDIAVSGASPVVEAEIRAGLFDVIGASSLALDPVALLRRIRGLGWIEQATVTLEAPDLLRVDVVERAPAAVWRIDGDLWLIDRRGAQITALFGRDEYPSLPLVAGAGAEKAVPEALELVTMAGPLAARLRGLVRVGERRWDLVLEPALVVQLPMGQPDERSEAPRDALGTVLALHAEYGLLHKDITHVDMRLPRRPTVRLHPRSAARRDDALMIGERG